MPSSATKAGRFRPSLQGFLENPLAFTRHRVAVIFREDSAWAEFSSGVAVLVFGLFLLLGKGPEEYLSLELATDLFPGHTIAFVTFAGGLAQILGLFFNLRFVRASAAMGVVLWLGSLSFLVWPIFPFSPFLGATVAWCFPNLLVVARHARDW